MVRRTLVGDDEAFSTLVRRYRRAATACACAVVGDPVEAEEVAHDAMVHAYEHLSTLTNPDRFAPWLLVAVRRRALNVLRATRGRREEDLDPTIAVPASQQPDAELLRRDRRESIQAALLTLTPVQREVVLLADAGDQSHAEIAEILRISVFMSRRHLSEARRRLRERLSSLWSER